MRTWLRPARLFLAAVVVTLAVVAGYQISSETRIAPAAEAEHALAPAAIPRRTAAGTHSTKRRKNPMPQPTHPGRRLHLAGAVVALATVVGCQGGPTTFLGYQLGPAALYDQNIKTVYVPVFYNRAFQTTPYRGMEVDVTRAVVREITSKTTFKVVSDPEKADTELRGNIVSIGKNVLNRNQQNLPRESEVVITVDVLWRDLRDGRNLSAPRRAVNPNGGPPLPTLQPPEPVPFDPDVPLPPPAAVVQNDFPVRIVATGRLIPELGESTTTGEQKAINQLAIQIVSMMEKPW
ncbi:MAG: hypothetical protein JWO38_7939 [Gemmataceae bacterium]|nr:hypothetical protein [Gemmataceae bacterium]